MICRKAFPLIIILYLAVLSHPEGPKIALINMVFHQPIVSTSLNDGRYSLTMNADSYLRPLTPSISKERALAYED